MKRIMAIVLGFGLLVVSPVFAGEAEHRGLAEDLLSIMKVEDMTMQYFDQIKQIQMSQLQSMDLPEKNKEEAEALQRKIMDFITDEFSWDKLKEGYIDIYVKIFSESEIEEIIEFHKSPIGQKMIEKQPEIMAEAMQMSQKRMEDIMPKLENMMTELESKME